MIYEYIPHSAGFKIVVFCVCDCCMSWVLSCSSTYIIYVCFEFLPLFGWHTTAARLRGRWVLYFGACPLWYDITGSSLRHHCCCCCCRQLYYDCCFCVLLCAVAGVLLGDTYTWYDMYRRMKWCVCTWIPEWHVHHLRQKSSGVFKYDRI